ncbi:MAG: N-acetylmuramoyl-L-alanine amidase [Oscillospiraceae bacterium]|nr:N-acetylmuramoyl-L-alanine amidase [Oscillospiraceae bacterium]
MSNSALVSYTKISPNKTSPRTHAIDTITIHHMAGNLSIENCCAAFAKSSRQASANYCIGSDGRIGLCVDEGDRSWCSSSRENDHRAITIEVANSKAAEPWPVSDEAYTSLLNLLVDICNRNGIEKLVWSDSKDDRVNHRNGCNMTVHRDFAATACPGTTLMGKMATIAAQVNARLGYGTTTTTTLETEDDTMTYEQFKEYMKQYRAELQDNDAGSWSKEDREWAISNGMMVGSGTTASGEPNYMWADVLTREQAATLMHRLVTTFNLG